MIRSYFNKGDSLEPVSRQETAGKVGHRHSGCARRPPARLFAYLLTLVESIAAGRAYAAYGGIYIAPSLAWLWESTAYVPIGGA